MITLYKSILQPHLTKVITLYSSPCSKGWGGRFLSRSAVLSWGTRIKALQNRIIPFIMLAQPLHLVYRSLLPDAWCIRWRIQNSSWFVRLIATEGKNKENNRNQWRKNKYENTYFCWSLLHIDWQTSWWKTQKLLKCSPTEKQGCPLWACLPCCSCESCAWLGWIYFTLLYS